MSVEVYANEHINKSHVTDRGIDVVIHAMLEDTFGEICDSLRESIDGAAKAAEDALKVASPYRAGSGRGHYRSGWKHRTVYEDFDYKAVVFNRNKPTLSHLLEYGHRLMRGKKRTPTYHEIGYVPGIPHISKGYEAASAYLKSKGWG